MFKEHWVGEKLSGLLCAAVAFTIMFASTGFAQTNSEEDTPTRRGMAGFDTPAEPVRSGNNFPLVAVPEAPLTPDDGGSEGETDGDRFGNPVGIELVYTEAVSNAEGQKQKGCTSDGLTGGVNCVSVRMDGPTQGGDGVPEREETLDARLSVTVKPVVFTVEEGKVYYLWFEVGAPSLRIPADLSEEALRQARGDARIVLSRLNKWARSLTGDSAEKLRELNKVTIRLLSPFQGLRKLKLVKPVGVKFQIGPTPEIRLRFVRREGDLFVPLRQAVHGSPFFLEALFKNPDEDRFAYDVKIGWTGGSGKFVKVGRSDNNPKLFRSKPIYIEGPRP